MKRRIYLLRIYGHDDFENTGIILKAYNHEDVFSQARWMYPNLHKGAIEIVEQAVSCDEYEYFQTYQEIP